VGNGEVVRKRKTKEELLRRLLAIEDELEFEAFGRDHEAYWETVQEKWETIRELQERFDWRPGRPFLEQPRETAPPPPAIRPAKPTVRICAHTRCGKQAHTIDVPDDHDSNAGMYYLNDYCSYECFVCDLVHARDRDDSKRIADIIKMITG
jgi:hypothetical protein